MDISFLIQVLFLINLNVMFAVSALAACEYSTYRERTKIHHLKISPRFDGGPGMSKRLMKATSCYSFFLSNK
jgi:hypothetical protein